MALAMTQQNYTKPNPNLQNYVLSQNNYAIDNQSFHVNNINNNNSYSQHPPQSPIANFNPNSPVVGQYQQIMENYPPTSLLPPNLQYPVVDYKEKLFLKQVLVVATFTSWKFTVKENIDAFANNILVSVRGEFEPFHQPNSVSIPVCYCQSVDDYHFHAKSRRLVSDIPTWKAYRLPSEIDRVCLFIFYCSFIFFFIFLCTKSIFVYIFYLQRSFDSFRSTFSSNLSI